MLQTRPIRVGLPLSATFSSVPDAALMSFYHWLCDEAHNRFMTWRAHEGQVGEGGGGVVFQHESTFRALEQQRSEGRGSLSLTCLKRRSSKRRRPAETSRHGSF